MHRIDYPTPTSSESFSNLLPFIASFTPLQLELQQMEIEEMNKRDKRNLEQEYQIIDALSKTVDIKMVRGQIFAYSEENGFKGLEKTDAEIFYYNQLIARNKRLAEKKFNQQIAKEKEREIERRNLEIEFYMNEQ